MLAAYESGAQC